MYVCERRKCQFLVTTARTTRIAERNGGFSSEKKHAFLRCRVQFLEDVTPNLLRFSSNTVSDNLRVVTAPLRFGRHRIERIAARHDQNVLHPFEILFFLRCFDELGAGW